MSNSINFSIHDTVVSAKTMTKGLDDLGITANNTGSSTTTTFNIPSMTQSLTLSELEDLNVYLDSFNTISNGYVYPYGYDSPSSGIVNAAYSGGVFSPVENRIYMIPALQSTQSDWHFIDCNTNNIVAYTHGATVVGSYSGGAYVPTLNRIYMAPVSQASESTWHYIDCNTGEVVAYAHGQTISTASTYSDAVYSPTEDRVYFIPFEQSDESQWHYIDCSTGNVVDYTHGQTISSNAYNGGVYSPVQNRIYMVPSFSTPQSVWHYIDCNDGDVVAYESNATIVFSSDTFSGAYRGGVYDPHNNRIYFIPAAQALESQWHYINCNTGDVVAYTHGATVVDAAYRGGAYSLTQNRIYMAPHNQGQEDDWHYIDCDDGTVVSYTHPSLSISEISAYDGANYNHADNSTWFIPFSQSNESKWHKISEATNFVVDKNLVAHSMFNN